MDFSPRELQEGLKRAKTHSSPTCFLVVFNLPDLTPYYRAAALESTTTTGARTEALRRFRQQLLRLGDTSFRPTEQHIELAYPGPIGVLQLETYEGILYPVVFTPYTLGWIAQISDWVSGGDYLLPDRTVKPFQRTPEQVADAFFAQRIRNNPYLPREVLHESHPLLFSHSAGLRTRGQDRRSVSNAKRQAIPV